MAKGVRETLFLGLFAVVCMGLPVGGLLWGTWWTQREQIETAADGNRLGAALLFAALRGGSPDTADEVRAIAGRHGDVEKFEAHADRATFTVEFVSLYVTTRETDGRKYDCYAYVWSYAVLAESSYTGVECGR